MTGSRECGRGYVRSEDLFSVGDYLRETRDLAARSGFSENLFLRTAEYELPVFRRAGEGGPWLYVSAGVHGDEPAGPLGIREVLRADKFSRHFGWFLVPVVNPTGLARGTRETDEGIDLNRDYKSLCAEESRAHRAFLEAEEPRFEAALGLHEDWEATGAYLYEHNPDRRPHPREALLDVLGATIGRQGGDEIDGWPTAAEGLIHPPSDPSIRENWPEQIYLLERHTRMSYTVETPSEKLLADRVLAMKAVLLAFADPANWKE